MLHRTQAERNRKKTTTHGAWRGGEQTVCRSTPTEPSSRVEYRSVRNVFQSAAFRTPGDQTLQERELARRRFLDSLVVDHDAPVLLADPEVVQAERGEIDRRQ